jgi:hypothetical protein
MCTIALRNELRNHSIEPAHFDFGRQYIRCPECAHKAKHARNRRARKLALEIFEDGRALWICNNCGWHGGVSNSFRRESIGSAELAQTRAISAARKEAEAAGRLNRAQQRWTLSIPANGTATATYLRQRGYVGPIPATIRHLPSTTKFAPAMISAFGFPQEAEPGVLTIDRASVRATHLTRLRRDGSDRLRNAEAKLTPGLARGVPIVLAPINDGLSLAITEGIEDGLSVYAATGLGVWAAGSASFMSALSSVVPDYVESVTIYRHDDEDGRRGARDLAQGLYARDIEVFLCPLTSGQEKP